MLGTRDILNALPNYAILVDEDHNVLEANDTVYRNLALERKDIIGKYCPKVIHGYDHPFPGCPLEEAAEKNSPIERELYDRETGPVGFIGYISYERLYPY